MPLRVLIVPDKFKGTLTARAAALAIAKGWQAARPADKLERLPMTDGGDGFGEVMGRLSGATIQKIATIDAAGRPCRASWWWQPEQKLAIIESATVNALARHGGFHPFELDTFGLGAVLQAASAAGARRCLVGVGGSATNDGGFGVARALGWTFLDRDGMAITRWTELARLAALRAPRRKHWFRELIVAVDVQNPLLGARGCTRIYGPQKGLKPGDFPAAEKCLRRLAAVVEEHAACGYEREPGAGAAGGLGFGLRAFASAELRPGFDLFADAADLERRLAAADLVITGEGAIDQSSLMGKGAGRMARECLKRKIPCLGLAGFIAPGGRTEKCFTRVRGLTELTSVENARNDAASWLEKLAEAMAREWRE